MSPFRDYYGMNCEAAREATSAQLDGEPAGVELARLEAHLAGCAACRAWRERAHDVTRRARLESASSVPSPGASLLTALRAAERRRGWWRSLPLTRGALALVAVGQLVVTIQPLLYGTDHNAPMHVAHELGAFDMALAVGFLVAALRPARAQGMRALVGCAALLLVATAVIDLITGRTTVSDELPHLLAVAGWLLLRRIATLSPQGADEPTLSLPTPVWRAVRVLRPRMPDTEVVDVARSPDTWGAEPARGIEIPDEVEPPARRVAGAR
jgi:predicted anti-sigma-YlaC factor YlaD